jgi:hypothetical protein
MPPKKLQLRHSSWAHIERCHRHAAVHMAPAHPSTSRPNSNAHTDQTQNTDADKHMDVTARHNNTSKPPAVLHLAAAASRQLLLPARGWGRAARCERCTARVFKRFNAAGMQPRPAATFYNAWMYVPVDRSSAVPLQVLAQLQDAALAIGRLKIVSSPFRRAYDHLLHALRRQPTAQRLAGQSPPNGDR